MADKLPQVFVGCAVQDLEVAHAVQQNLDHDAELEIWTEGTFVASNAALESLVAKANIVDFAILIATGVDELTRKIERKISIDRSVVELEHLAVPRDNVIFEFALFMGVLGKRRTFLVVDRSKSPKLPTDLSGINYIDYDGGKSNAQSAVGAACTTMRLRMKELGRRGTADE